LLHHLIQFSQQVLHLLCFEIKFTLLVLERHLCFLQVLHARSNVASLDADKTECHVGFSSDYVVMSELLFKERFDVVQVLDGLVIVILID